MPGDGKREAERFAQREANREVRATERRAEYEEEKEAAGRNAYEERKFVQEVTKNARKEEKGMKNGWWSRLRGFKK